MLSPAWSSLLRIEFHTFSLSSRCTHWPVSPHRIALSSLISPCTSIAGSALNGDFELVIHPGPRVKVTTGPRTPASGENWTLAEQFGPLFRPKGESGGSRCFRLLTQISLCRVSGLTSPNITLPLVRKMCQIGELQLSYSSSTFVIKIWDLISLSFLERRVSLYVANKNLWLPYSLFNLVIKHPQFSLSFLMYWLPLAI